MAPPTCWLVCAASGATSRCGGAGRGRLLSMGADLSGWGPHFASRGSLWVRLCRSRQSGDPGGLAWTCLSCLRLKAVLPAHTPKVHTVCSAALTPECSLGRLRTMILPPACVRLLSRNFSKMHCFRISESVVPEPGEHGAGAAEEQRAGAWGGWGESERPAVLIPQARGTPVQTEALQPAQAERCLRRSQVRAQSPTPSRSPALSPSPSPHPAAGSRPFPQGQTSRC